MPGDQVNVFVDRDARGLLAGAPHDDIVPVSASEIVGNRGFVKAVRRVFLFRSEHYDVDRHGLGWLALVYLQEEIAHALEIAQGVACVPLPGARIGLEIGGLHANPFTLGIGVPDAEKRSDYQPFKADHEGYLNTTALEPGYYGKCYSHFSATAFDHPRGHRGNLARRARNRCSRWHGDCAPADTGRRSRARVRAHLPNGPQRMDFLSPNSGCARPTSSTRTAGGRSRPPSGRPSVPRKFAASSRVMWHFGPATPGFTE